MNEQIEQGYQNQNFRSLPDDIESGAPVATAETADDAKWVSILNEHLQGTSLMHEITTNLMFSDEQLDECIIDGATPTDAPDIVVGIDSVRAMSMGDISAIVGGAKSRKTLFATAIANQLIRPDDVRSGVVATDLAKPLVLYVDTEQSPFHARCTYDRIIDGVPDDERHMLIYLALREFSYMQRIKAMCAAIHRHRPQFVIVDGVADLMPDTNSNADAAAIVGVLMALAKTYECHICSILHTSAANVNKGRGHAGSEIERKSESVFLVSKDNDDLSGLSSIVSAQYTRNPQFANMRISHTSDGGYTLELIEPKTIDDEMNCVLQVIKRAKQIAADTMPDDTPPTTQIRFKMTAFKQFIQAASAGLSRKHKPCGDKKAASIIEVGTKANGMLKIEQQGTSKFVCFDDWPAYRTNPLNVPAETSAETPADDERPGRADIDTETETATDDLPF